MSEPLPTPQEEIETSKEPQTETPAPIKDEVEEILESLSTEVQSLDLATYSFKVARKGAPPMEFALIEMDADQRGAFINAQAQVGKYGSKGEVLGFRDIKSLEIEQLAPNIVGKTGRLKPKDIVGWPGKLISKLHKVLLRISGLDAKAEERAKNS